MKPTTTFLVIIITLIGVFTTNAQEFTTNNSSSNLKRGIYRTFEEFKNNNPSIELTHKIVQIQKNTGGIIEKQKTTFYHLHIDKDAAKKIGKVYGFSDGENMYINELNPKLKPKVLFMRVAFIGNYGVLEYKAFNTIDSLPSRNTVIDMNTGSSKMVSKKKLINLTLTKDKSYVAVHVDMSKTTFASGK